MSQAPMPPAAGGPATDALAPLPGRNKSSVWPVALALLGAVFVLFMAAGVARNRQAGPRLADSRPVEAAAVAQLPVIDRNADLALLTASQPQAGRDAFAAQGLIPPPSTGEGTILVPGGMGQPGPAPNGPPRVEVMVPPVMPPDVPRVDSRPSGGGSNAAPAPRPAPVHVDVGPVPSPVVVPPAPAPTPPADPTTPPPTPATDPVPPAPVPTPGPGPGPGPRPAQAGLPSDLELAGVVEGDNSMAVFESGGRTIRRAEGERLGGLTVKRIEAGRVELESSDAGGTRSHWLPLREGPMVGGVRSGPVKTVVRPGEEP